MAKTHHSNINYQLKNELRNMFSPGESKKEAMAETNRLRAIYKKELIEQGYSKKEAHRLSININTYRDKIYTDSTLYRHQKSADVFGQFCKEELGTKRISMEEAKLHVQDFVNWSKKKNHSTSTTKTYLAGVCKALQLNISDYDKPKCFTSEFTRGTKPAKNDAYNEVRAEKALDTNSIIGVRRSELGRIKVSDIDFISPDYAEIHTIGKGGKHNTNVLFTTEDVAKLKMYADDAISKGQTYLLTKEEMKNDADLHSMRAKKAKAVYEHVCADMDAHPERRDYYISEIHKTFQKTGKVLREDLSKDYVCIGKNRQRLISQGRSYTFDRVAVMIVSCWVTNHFRSNVTVNNYIAK